MADAQGQPGAADASVADSYSIDTRAVSETTGTIGSLLSHTADVIGGMVGAVPDGAVFGGIGRAVASASQALSDSQVSALDQVRQALEHVNRGIDASNLGYQQVDQAVAAGFGAVVGAQPAAAAEQPATAPAADMTTDRELRDQLAADEGNEQHVYTDTEGHPSVGIGFNLDRADARSRLAAVGADYTAVRNGTQDLTADQVNRLFSHDVGTAVDTARDYYAGFDQLDAARQRTLTNMAFNLGAARLGGFHQLHDVLANGDWNAAADAMQDSRWARQVPNRADRLIDHMRTGQ
ncbi:glycoside hydrolase family protein [Actinocatenispora rupis]|uniref:glycoside hydrolase family protein n=1 Tax=Actinocatenispora rupis TaxID=519421 RepID=UPI0019441BB0|nr:glycoside hydrolase family protein [Actinocatenispora rupis]